jgi:nitrogen regulatory protein PII
MKKIEMVITGATLDAFKNSAFQLGIAEFDVTEVYRSSCAPLHGPSRLCHLDQSTGHLSPRLRVGFVLFDENVKPVLNQLLQLVRPEHILVSRVDQEFSAIPLANSHLAKPIARTREELSTQQLPRRYPETGSSSAAPNGIGIKPASRHSY